MNARQSIVWMGVAALAAAFFAAVISMRQEEKAPLRPPVEPNLFPFLKPLNSVTPNGGAKAAVDDALTLKATVQKQEKPEAPVQITTIEKSARKMRNEGAGEDDLYRMRAAALSPETAARLAEMEREEMAWNARISTYLAERSKLLEGSGSVTDTDRLALLQQLRNTRFTAEEQRLLAAYESPNVPQLILD